MTVEPQGVELLGSRAVLLLSPGTPTWPGAQAVAADAGRPIGWFDWLELSQRGPAFVSRSRMEAAPAMAGLHVWVIGPRLVAALHPRWPVGADLRASIDSVGPGGESVWIDAGASQAIGVGDCWWQRRGGQPVARYDVRLVERDVCFCRVVPLVAGFRPAPGGTVTLWPGPGTRRSGRSVTAVSYVEPSGQGQLVWVAAPPECSALVEPRLEFLRDGQYVGSGVVERRDGRFWYVQMLPAAGVAPIHVGDEAVVRTLADIRERRFTARVFEQTPTGYLINAGEADGLAVGEKGSVYQAGTCVGEIQITRVQRSYSVVRPVEGRQRSPTTQAGADGASLPSTQPAALQRLDEVRFTSRLPPSPALGVLESVADGTLFTARVSAAAAPPPRTPLVIRREGRTVGVAVLLEVADGDAVGFAVARSLVEPLAIGNELALPARSE